MEDAADLLADLDQALAAATQAVAEMAVVGAGLVGSCWPACWATAATTWSFTNAADPRNLKLSADEASTSR